MWHFCPCIYYVMTDHTHSITLLEMLRILSTDLLKTVTIVNQLSYGAAGLESESPFNCAWICQPSSPPHPPLAPFPVYHDHYPVLHVFDIHFSLPQKGRPCPAYSPFLPLQMGCTGSITRCVPPLHLAGPAVFISQGQLSQPWKLVSRQAIGLATGHGPCTRVLPEHGKYKHATLFCVPPIYTQSIT